MAEAAGVSAVTVHARSKEARHAGPADLEALASVVSAVKVPVIGNGGIRHQADAEKMREATGCAGVMVGQAAMGNPFLFLELLGKGSGLTISERLQCSGGTRS